MMKFSHVVIVCLGLLAQAAGFSPVAGAAEYPTLRVAGAEQLVVSADSMSCASDAKKEWDVPDVPPTAYRLADGTVMLIAGNRQNFTFHGPSLDEVKRVDCQQILKSAGDDDPADFRDQEWVTALYSNDGARVLGFVHNEFHGEYRDKGECQTKAVDVPECWYASATLVVSTDGGKTFTRPDPPGNVILTLPYPYATDMKQAGVFMPKVVGGQDGNVYVLATYGDRNRSNKPGQCLARGSAEHVGKWEVWTGAAFEAVDPSPYGCSGQCIGRVVQCASVVPNNMFSVKYMPAHQLYIAVGIRRSDVIYRFSSDLVSWSPPKVLMTPTVKFLWKEGDPPPVWYPSLLDPSSSSRNFDTIGDRPFLYLVKYRVADGKLDRSRRDIVRIPLSFLPPE